MRLIGIRRHQTREGVKRQPNPLCSAAGALEEAGVGRTNELTVDQHIHVGVRSVLILRLAGRGIANLNRAQQ